MASEISEAYDKGKAHAIIVVAEGAKYNAEALREYFSDNRDRLGFSLRLSILGHTQRGGIPTAYDRNLASRLGAEAVHTLDRGESGVLVGMLKSELATTPLDIVVNTKNRLI